MAFEQLKYRYTANLRKHSSNPTMLLMDVFLLVMVGFLAGLVAGKSLLLSCLFLAWGAFQTFVIWKPLKTLLQAENKTEASA